MPSDATSVRRWLDDIHHHIILARKFTESMWDTLTFHLPALEAVIVIELDALGPPG